MGDEERYYGSADKVIGWKEWEEHRGRKETNEERSGKREKREKRREEEGEEERKRKDEGEVRSELLAWLQ